MSTVIQSCRDVDDDRSFPAPVPLRTFMVLGGPAPDVSGLNLLNLEGAVGSACDGIILIKHIDPAELANVLSEAPDPAVPIADFFGNHPIRHDFTGSLLNDESAKEMQRSLAPIWRRLKEVPYRAHAQDRTGMTILRLAYSRASPIKATFDPGYPLTVQYPLVGTGAGARQHLERLASEDLLHRNHFTRTHGCSKCGSARLNIYEACPACGSGDLNEDVLIHHYRCGCQEAEARFIQGAQLICPKCRRELRHFGVDYGKPGKIVVCRSCGAKTSEPNSCFACMDCSAVTSAERAASTDWYHYDLAEKGMTALREGRLPHPEFAPVLEKLARHYSQRDFRLLAMQEMRTASQLKRPFTVARVSFPNIDAIRRDFGMAATDAAVQSVTDAIIATVRTSDFVGVGSAPSVIGGFPGTSRDNFAVIEERLRQSIQAAIEGPLEFAIEVADGDAISQIVLRN
jgi:GGDEF domain-containing protein